jgi:hypothetical protein
VAVTTRRRADDEVWRVHARWLGPPGWTLPVSVPYRAVLPAFAAGAGAVMLLGVLGAGGWRFAVAAVAAVAVGAAAARSGGSGRPVSELPGLLLDEAGAPRPAPRAPDRAVLRPGRVPVRPTPRDGRRWW